VKCKTILKKRRIPQRGLYGTADLIFMHDCNSCHECGSVTEFLEAHGIETLPWPGNSTNMNSIENLWSLLKSEMHKTTIRNKQRHDWGTYFGVGRDDRVRSACKELIHSKLIRVAALNIFLLVNVSCVIGKCAQTIQALRILRSHGLCNDALHRVQVHCYWQTPLCSERVVGFHLSS